MAPIVNLLKSNSNFSVKVCVTGQHREMLDQVLDIFNIVPDYDLKIMTHNQSLNNILSTIVYKLDEIIKDFQPFLTLVHGDTTTAFAASVTSYYNKVFVAHIEAGLRTGDLYSPWPEEGNRKLISTITKLHFTPTLSSYNNLIKEGLEAREVYITGNTVIDSLLQVKNKIISDKLLFEKLTAEFSYLNNKKFILVTGHRRENYGDGFKSICNALKKIAIQNSDIQIVYPVHLNPNVNNIVKDLLSDISNIYLISPLEYLPFVFLMMKSYIILTDSGGIQEEAPSLGKPVLVMRNTTERPEAVEAGTVQLVGNNEEIIVKKINELLDSEEEYNRMTSINNPYGDGKASQKIVDILIHFKSEQNK
jgi:UDP-N-acetylglucosamine 2-epimerase (non-hydrolysing)